jgi:hypothetical protein
MLARSNGSLALSSIQIHPLFKNKFPFLREQNMVMGSARPGAKIDSAGEAHQRFSIK